MATREELDMEKTEISDLIRATPRDIEEKVRNYHAEIIKRLDSGAIITVPSLEHRNFHQEMWIFSFMIYNGYESFNEAVIHFFTEESRGDKGEFGSQKTRFGIWYDKTYIKPYLAKTSEQYRWAQVVDNVTAQESDKILHKPLDEVVVRV